ncbi:tetratricopeptide repeat protein [Owenweeksia hongkongensis]|uniref:tetratricopeptide repeat protein n=1 Tax=Owenweeksia hongkongensis TaxID=253245 RepID=UPI003A8C8DCD
MIGKHALRWGILLTIAVSVFLLSRCDNSSVKNEPENTQVTYLNHNDTVKYVGIETCKQCHYSIYETFVQTGMGSSFGHADTSKSIADIDGESLLRDLHKNLNYHPHWVKDSLVLTEFRLSGSDTTYKRNETIDYVVGSGQHTNSHMIYRNNYLFQAPFTWYAQKGMLDLPPGFEDGRNTRFKRLIGLECTSCHNAMPTGFEKGSINKYAKVPSAIDCERCHGPGEIHVKRMMAGEFVDTANEIDYSIVNIKKLPVDLQFEACQRCHLQGNAVVAEGKSFFDFKPGMKLNTVMDVYLPRYSNAEDEFIMASHIDRFKQSECFIHSDNQFNCTTCHNPHISVKHTNISNFNATCANCHKGAPKHECTEEISALQAAEFNCVSCHMPQSGSTDIPHVSVHDHKIKVPQKKVDTSGIKEFLGLVAINNPKPTDRSKALGYLQQYERFDAKPYYLDSARFFLNRMGAQEENPSLWVTYYFLKNYYSDIQNLVNKVGVNAMLARLNTMSYDNADAWTAYRIGESFRESGQETSLKFYSKAIELAPYVPDFMNKKATALAGVGRLDEAVTLFKKLLKEQPKHAEALNNLGYTYLQMGNITLAGLNFDKALAVDPDYLQAWLNKASLLIMQEYFAEAKKALKEVLRLNPNHERALQAMAYLNQQS